MSASGTPADGARLVKSGESPPHTLGDCLEQAHNPDSTMSKLGNRTALG